MKLNIKKIKKNIETKYKEYLNKTRLISFLRFINFILIIIFLCLTSNNNIYIILSIISIISFIILIIIHDKYYKEVDYYQTYINILNEYELRINGKWDTLPNNGEEYINDKNIYLEDLDILGKHSLYQFLCSAKTKIGKDKLYNNLNNIELSKDKLKERQKIIEELVNNKEFILEFQIYLSKLDENINLEDNLKELDNKINNNLFILLTILGNGITIILLILSLIKIIPITYFYTIVIFKYLFSYIYSFIYKEELSNIIILSRNLSKLNPILQYINNKKFNTKELNQIKDNITKSINIINKIDMINSFANLKSNFLANIIFNGILTIDPYILYQYYQLQKNQTNTLKNSIEEIENLECYISLSNIALTKDKICFPTLCNEISLEFNNLKHPLLDEEKCIPNDYKKEANINIITGSNMSGKTSFLRTIGINLILANAGTYVCADSFTSSYLKIFTSMRVQDNIEKGISTFYGELLRIKEAITYQEKDKPMIVLIDEIFKGTNYNDRLLGATNVIKKLNKNNVILLLTTHDFELCDTNIAKVDNYHFTEYYEKNNIKFDYKIRKGKCTTTNAKYLMKRLNILEEDQ